MGSELTVYRTALEAEEALTLTEGVELPNLPPRHELTPESFGVIDLPGHMGDGALPGGRDYATMPAWCGISCTGSRATGRGGGSSTCAATTGATCGRCWPVLPRCWAGPATAHF